MRLWCYGSCILRVVPYSNKSDGYWCHHSNKSDSDHLQRPIYWSANTINANISKRIINLIFIEIIFIGDPVIFNRMITLKDSEFVCSEFWVKFLWICELQHDTCAQSHNCNIFVEYQETHNLSFSVLFELRSCCGEFVACSVSFFYMVYFLWLNLCWFYMLTIKYFLSQLLAFQCLVHWMQCISVVCDMISNKLKRSDWKDLWLANESNIMCVGVLM